jgi:hypothetical protein
MDRAAISEPTKTETMMRTHQSHKTAQLRLLEIVEFAIKAISISKMGPLPLVARVFMQCKSIVVQLEAKK